MINIDEQTTTPAVDSTIEQPQAEIDSQPTVEAPKTEQPTTEESGNEESFFDPTNVPEELKPAYKQMQAAFTKKTQEIAEARKAAEAAKADAESYAKYKQYIPVVEEMLSGQKAQTQSPELAALEQQLKSAGYSDEAIEMMKISGNFFLNHFNQTQQAKEREAWLDSKITEASKLDERLTDPSLTYQTDDNETVTFGQLVERLVASDPSWVSDPVTATKKAIKTVDALIGKAKTEGKEELSASAKAKAAKFPKENSSPQGATLTDRVMTVQEAFKEAKKELGI